jgi:hypothetical protein
MISHSVARSIVLCLFWLGSPLLRAGWLDPRFDLPGADGPIQSLVAFRGGLYAVGFSERIAGVAAPGVARWDGTNWMAIQPAFNASVAAAVATDEAVYFAASQRKLDQPSGLLRWDGRTWTVLGVPPGYRDVAPDSLLVHGTNVYMEVLPEVSGTYATAALAKWDGHAWSVLAPTRLAQVGSHTHFAFAQERLYAAGALYVPSTQAPLYLAQLVQNDWLAVGGGIGTRDGYLGLGIASDGMNLFVGGPFTTVGSMPAQGFAIWDGDQWFNPPAPGESVVSAVSLTENVGEVLGSESLYTNYVSSHELISQHLVQYRGTNRTVLARGDAGGMALMRRWGEGVYCAGEFRAVGGIPTGNLALWTGTNWTRVGGGNFQGLTAQATCLAVGGSNVYVAGTFEYAGEVTAKHIARWDGRRWHGLGSGLDGTVVQMAARGDNLFVVGAFTSAGGAPATNVAWWNGTTWSALAGGLSGRLSAIVATEQHVLVARIVDASQLVVSRWDGAAWGDVASGTFESGGINTILAMGDSIFVGGRFQSINGVEVNNLGRWDGVQWHSVGGGLSVQVPWLPNPNEFPFIEVRALLLDGTNLYAGGSFSKAGSVPAMNVARWDGTQWSALGDGIPGLGSCLWGSCVFPITSLALVQGKLFAGGGFRTELGNRPGYLARWDGSTWTNVVDGDWSVDIGQPIRDAGELHVWALASRGGDLHIAGNFAKIGDVPSYGLAMWHEGDPPALQASYNAGRLMLSAPRSFQYATVEFTDSLSGTLWKPIPDLDWQVSQTATNLVETRFTPSSSQSFYRLRWN